MASSNTGVRTAAVLAAALTIFVSACSRQPATPIPPPTFVAHAGGIGNHRVYTNSREALEHSVAVGHSAIEIDLSWTSDGHLVLVHDWDREFSKIFGKPPGRVSLSEFRAARSPWSITQLTLDDLGPFLEENPQITFVTDIKERNIEGLERIAARYPALLGRFAPQIYHPEELGPVRDLGFENIIWTLYRSELSDQEIEAVVTDETFWAVTMPLARTMNGDLAARIAASGQTVFAHTVNDRLTMEGLRRTGVSGVYTDWLAPSDGLVQPDATPWFRETEDLEALDDAVVSFVPWAMDQLQLVLALTNPGDEDESIGIAACDSSGQTIASIEVEVGAGEVQPIDINGFASSGHGQGWLRLETGSHIDLQLQRQFGETAPQLMHVDRHSFRRMSTRGSGRGLSGLLLAVVNPTGSKQTYHLRRRIGDEVIDAEDEDVGPGHQLIRIYRSSTDEEIEITVTGGPMVADTLRWDSLIRWVW